MVDEIGELVERHGVRYIEFAGDDFMGTGARGRRRALEIGRQITARGLDISWYFIARPNDIDEGVLRELMASGLVGVDVGVETWAPDHLAFFDKKLTADVNERATEVLSRLGLRTRFYVIPLNPCWGTWRPAFWRRGAP